MESLSSPIVLLFGLGIIGLAPFLAVMVSSYLKISVVLYILRNAIGLQQAPPNMAINGLAIILTLYIMAPVGIATHERFQSHNVDLNDLKNPAVFTAVKDSVEPVRDFLKRHSDDEEREFFMMSTRELWPEEQAKDVTRDHMLVLLPSFTLSQLTSAFEVGFLLYLPFVIIDLVVSNILLAMGMIMLSPIIISLPFKILLFVMVDGWSRLIHGIVLSYQ